MVYAPFAIRLDEATTSDATVTVTSVPTGDLGGLTYTVSQPATLECDASTDDDPLFADQDLATAVQAGTTIDLTANAAGVAGTPAYLCFVVTAGNDLAEGSEGDVVWSFAAVQD